MCIRDSAEPGRKPDLGIRTVTAIAIVVVAGLALWLGDWWSVSYTHLTLPTIYSV